MQRSLLSPWWTHGHFVADCPSDSLKLETVRVFGRAEGDSMSGDLQDDAESEEKTTALSAKRKRRRKWIPKFRLMDLIWMVLLAAVLMKWHTDHRALVLANQKIAAQGSLANLNTRASWSIRQLLGKPDTPTPGDQSTAWASQLTDASPEWVVVEFPTEVELAKVEVVETYNPGAIDRICAVSFLGTETEIWKGKDPTPTSAAMGKSMFPIAPGTTSRRIKLFINSPAVPGWNEIDAVAIHGTDGSTQWASDAWASSAFGSNQELPSWFWP